MSDAAAVLRGDFATMEKSWAEDLVVNSNNQMTRGRENILRRIRAGDIGTYSTFVREIESVVINRDAAIVMGLETVRSTSNARLTGETVRRRYMNIWMKREGEWLLTARQATVICQN
jgi:ketosteroid isomerase-like protein